MEQIETRELVLLHGAGGNAREQDPLGSLFASPIRSWCLNLLGHGGRPIPDSYGIKAIAEDVLDQVDRAGFKRVYFYGYSLGGYVALYLAFHHPDRVMGFCCTGTKFVWDTAWRQRIAEIFAPARLASRAKKPLPEWATAINERNYQRALAADPAVFLSDEQIARISRPGLIINGTEDPLVSADESRRLARLIPDSRLALYNGAAHPGSKVPLAETVSMVSRFIEDVEVTEPRRTNQF